MALGAPQLPRKVLIIEGDGVPLLLVDGLSLDLLHKRLQFLV